VVILGIVVLAASGFDRSRNVEICELSQKRIKALLFVVPIDLVRWAEYLTRYKAAEGESGSPEGQVA
jgi:hypothetical protein